MGLLNADPGSIVAVPAKKDQQFGFVLARTITPTGNRIIEVFQGFYTNFAITNEQVKEQDFSINNRLFPPIHAGLNFTKYDSKVKWPILLTDPLYDKEQSKYSEIEFNQTDYAYDESGLYTKGGISCNEPFGVRRNLQCPQIFSNPQLIFRINRHLSGQMAVGEVSNVYTERKFLDLYGLKWWTDSLLECQTLADEVATLMKEAQKKNQLRAKRLSAKAPAS